MASLYLNHCDLLCTLLDTWHGWRRGYLAFHDATGAGAPFSQDASPLPPLPSSEYGDADSGVTRCAPWANNWCNIIIIISLQIHKLQLAPLN
jgi:hypothetical protein